MYIGTAENKNFTCGSHLPPKLPFLIFHFLIKKENDENNLIFIIEWQKTFLLKFKIQSVKCL